MTPSDIADKPAFAAFSPSDMVPDQHGLTFRELAAIHICAGICTRLTGELGVESIANETVRQTDALVAALAKPPAP